MADTAANLLSFLPSLGTGEAFAFGEGVALPTRLKFKQLPVQMLPRSDTMGDEAGGEHAEFDSRSLAAVIDRWRGRVTRPRQSAADELRAANVPSPALQPGAAPVVPAPAMAPTAAPALDPNRFRLLKRSVDEPAGIGGFDRALPESPRR